eukprot:TRINITY_DN45105_c0_g1_i2.p2 TRINITY_DN45105_c0_g1~~TRINITY_DN45105_c0_g1_i2.p2  ORF type:complete len:179 (+),score=34.34 TRINITY_DN45105_c0_g1_i2:117-653(+)
MAVRSSLPTAMGRAFSPSSRQGICTKSKARSRCGSAPTQDCCGCTVRWDRAGWLRSALSDHEEKMLLYKHARNALEQTGSARDAEVLDDIWFVELDANVELRTKFERYNAAVKELAAGKLVAGQDDQRPPVTWAEFKTRFPETFAECMKEPLIRVVVHAGLIALAMLLAIQVVNGLSG